MTENFFNLPEHIKAQYPLNRNAGWESKAQIRPSTSTPDQKNLIKSLAHVWLAYIQANKNYRHLKQPC